MQGFERFAEFSRALKASRAASATGSNPYVPYTDDLRFAEGVLFSLFLMLPFWLLMAYGIERLVH